MEAYDNIIPSLYSDKGPLTKPQFVAIMEIIKDMRDRDDGFSADMAKAFSKHNGTSDSFALCGGFQNNGYNGKTVDLLIQWLVSVMGDHSCGDKVSDSWIAYYIHETDWGRNFDGTPVTSEDGTPIPFKTIDDVYALIVNHKK